MGPSTQWFSTSSCLTSARSWRAPCVGVGFLLRATPHPDPAGAGAPRALRPQLKRDPLGGRVVRPSLSQRGDMLLFVLTFTAHHSNSRLLQEWHRARAR